TGTTTITVPLVNHGLMDIRTGTVLSSGTGESSGTFQLAANTLFQFSFSTYAFQNGTRFSGPGLLRVTDVSYVTVTGAVNVEKAEFSRSATLPGRGTPTASGRLDWLGGQMYGTGATAVTATARLNIAGPEDKAITQRTLTNAGIATFTGPGVLFIEG